MRKIIFCLCICFLFACKNNSESSTEEVSFFGCACSEKVDVMVGSGGSICTSSHTALTWDKVNVGEKNTLLDVFCVAPHSSGNSSQRTKFYAAGHNGTVLISEDGLNWSVEKISSEIHLFAIAADKNKIVAVGHKKVIYVSGDEGATWQKIHSVANKGTSLYDVALGEGTWLAVGDYGAVLIVDDSTNDVSEKQVKLGINKALKGIAFAKSLNRWVAVGHEGVIFTSDDAGKTWQDMQGDTDEDLLSIAFNGKRFVAVGTHGIILTSKDGNIWKKVQVNNSGTFRSVSCIKDRWLLITIEGKKEVLEDGKME